jgi:four helix bundle protein
MTIKDVRSGRSSIFCNLALFSGWRMMTEQRFEKLAAWRHGVRLVESVYRATRRFPNDEKPGLSAVMRRAVAVVPGKIADGVGRCDPDEALRALEDAFGAMRELKTHLIVARRMRFTSAWRLAMVRRRMRFTEQAMIELREHFERMVDQRPLSLQLRRAA